MLMAAATRAWTLAELDRLPDDVTWEQLQYEIYVRQAVEAGLADSQAGRTVPLAEARKQFGLDNP